MAAVFSVAKHPAFQVRLLPSCFSPLTDADASPNLRFPILRDVHDSSPLYLTYGISKIFAIF